MAKPSLKILAITGRKGSGKNHVARLIINKVWRTRSDASSRQLSFAKPMKDICALLFRVPRHVFDLDDAIRVAYKTTWRWSEMCEELQKSFPNHGEFITVREAIQLMGYDVFRLHFSPTVWVRYMSDELDAQTCSLVVISDLRLPEEADMLRNRGAVLLRVVDPHAVIPEGGHKTETLMDSIKVDHTIQNDRKREPFDLEQELARIVFPA